MLLLVPFSAAPGAHHHFSFCRGGNVSLLLLTSFVYAKFALLCPVFCSAFSPPVALLYVFLFFLLLIGLSCYWMDATLISCYRVNGHGRWRPLAFINCIAMELEISAVLSLRAGLLLYSTRLVYQQYN